MTVSSIASRLASDGLQQHMFAAPTNVAEACKPVGYHCISSAQCCSGLWCDWLFTCNPV
ncbi:hypothetical protein ABTZ59_29010 [Streptomyces sp. NPDC094034]|uniref:hypothetical protein n=1 Tax=Streptomyces sp. NPDC094034 TaxID=3155309 RepID=UPI00331E3A9D